MYKLRKKLSLIFSLVVVLVTMSIIPCNSFASGSLSGKVICVDAGHGGSDSGTVGEMSMFGRIIKVYEKGMTLTLSLHLKELLESEGATVVMTRMDDYTVSINDRWRIATNNNVDAFISVHFDYLQASPGVLGLYGVTRQQDKTFAQTITNAVADATYRQNKGTVQDEGYAHDGKLGVLNYGGDYPRVLIEANNVNYIGMEGYEFAVESGRFANGVVNGLKSYFNN